MGLFLQPYQEAYKLQKFLPCLLQVADRWRRDGEKVKWRRESIDFAVQTRNRRGKDSFDSVQSRGAEGRQPRKKEVTHSECQFCNGTFLDLLVQCNFSIILRFSASSCAQHRISFSICGFLPHTTTLQKKSFMQST